MGVGSCSGKQAGAVGAALLAVAAALVAPTPAALAHSEELVPHEVRDTINWAHAAEGEQPAHPTAGGPVAPAPMAAADPAVSAYTVAPVRARPGASDRNRFALAGGCFALRSAEIGRLVARDGQSYQASVGTSRAAERFRMQATELGSYLLLGSEGRFLGTEGDGVRAAEEPAPRAEWKVRGQRGETFRLLSTGADRLLAVEPESGELVLTERGAGGQRTRFAFEAAGPCPAFPEIQVNATGRPLSGSPSYAEATGLINLHSHIMAFEGFGGGGWHCGRPWHRFGVARSLADCPDEHNPATPRGQAHNILTFQDNVERYADHHPGGWPDFEGWPSYETVFLHEQTYYRWIERTWRAGLRLLTLLAVDNSAACLANVGGTEGCNEMDAVRRQIRATYELQDYIDAQSGGPGEGWFRIVRNPFQARRVINQGKLAVVLGIEVSEPLDCGLRNGRPQCDREQIDRELDRVFRAGVRQMELVNKFDNAFSGVAMDSGAAGPVVNSANKVVTGEYWDVETCTGPDHDNTQETSVSPEAAPLIDLMRRGGQLQPPVYPPPPHCNRKGLSDLGAYVLHRMIERGMIFDPDHMSVRARSQALDLMAGEGYSGVVSSHSWADRTSYRRIMELGGVVTPMAREAERFVETWQERRQDFAEGRRTRRFGFGFGFGDDMNGLAGGRPPTGGTPAEISYPFDSLDGAVRFDRQQSGTRTFDINVDGVAHFGLWPDWAEGVREVGGQRVRGDLLGGAESYLRMWERAVGIRGPHARRARGRIGPRGAGRVRLGLTPRRLLRRVGQPQRRTRSWSYRVRGGKNRGGRLVVAFGHRRGRPGVELVATTAKRYSAARVRPGMSAARLAGRARRVGGGLWLREAGRAGSRFVYGVRRGRVHFVGVATRWASDRRGRLARLARSGIGS
jgi:hypothetical protein